MSVGTCVSNDEQASNMRTYQEVAAAAIEIDVGNAMVQDPLRRWEHDGAVGERGGGCCTGVHVRPELCRGHGVIQLCREQG